MTHFQWHQFSELSIEKLYAVLMLRAEVFVVEQHCPYLDPDGNDAHALHLLGMDQGALVAYLRLYLPTEVENYLSFGRVVTARSARSKGHGKQLIEELVNYCAKNFPRTNIQCSAQHYLVKFYESFGFKTHGDVYDEDGIPHIAMTRVP